MQSECSVLRCDPCSAVGSGWRFPMRWELLEGITSRHYTGCGPDHLAATCLFALLLPARPCLQGGPGRWMSPLLCTEGARSCLHQPSAGPSPLVTHGSSPGSTLLSCLQLNVMRKTPRPPRSPIPAGVLPSCPHPAPGLRAQVLPDLQECLTQPRRGRQRIAERELEREPHCLS